MDRPGRLEIYIKQAYSVAGSLSSYKQGPMRTSLEDQFKNLLN